MHTQKRLLQNKKIAAHFLAGRKARNEGMFKCSDHKFDVYYDPNRPIFFPNDCHFGSQSILTYPVVKKSQHECNKIRQNCTKLDLLGLFIHLFSTSYKHKKIQQFGKEIPAFFQRSSLSQTINVSAQFEV